MRIKTRKKSSAFWKHGKHKGALAHSVKVNKEAANKKKPAEMKESVAELMKGEKKR